MSNHIILTGKKQFSYRALRKKVGLQTPVNIFQCLYGYFTQKAKIMLFADWITKLFCFILHIFTILKCCF